MKKNTKMMMTKKNKMIIKGKFSVVYAIIMIRMEIGLKTILKKKIKEGNMKKKKRC